MLTGMNKTADKYYTLKKFSILGSISKLRHVGLSVFPHQTSRLPLEGLT